MPFPFSIYTWVHEGTEDEDIEEKTGKLLKRDLLGATVKEVYTETRGRNTSDILLTLIDGRIIHILPKCDGNGFEFCMWKEDQVPERSS